MESNSTTTSPDNREAQQLRQRIDELESRIIELDSNARVRRTFWNIVGTHAILLSIFAPAFQWEWPLGLLAGSLGTLCVWFAWTRRPLVQRISRAAVAITIVFGAVRVGMDKQIIETWSTAGLLALNLFIGMLAACSAFNWFLRAEIRIPGIHCETTRPSIKAILIGMTAVGLAFGLIPLQQGQLSHPIVIAGLMSVGVGFGVVASGAAIVGFRSASQRRFGLFVDVFAFIAIVVVALFLGNLLLGSNLSSATDLAFLIDICQFFLAFIVSPFITFRYLHERGYEFRVRIRSHKVVRVKAM